MKYKIINKNLPKFTGEAWLIELENPIDIVDCDNKKKYITQHFVASGTSAMFSGWEVLIFASDKDGKVIDWTELAGGRGISHEEAIDELLEKIKDGRIKEW